jgi:E3 ubiquitin-protein ligase HERC4
MFKEEMLSFFSDGALYAWGCNSYGQLGIGSQSKQQQKPTLVSSLAGIPIAFIACGGYHSFAVSKSGKLNNHCHIMARVCT